MMSFLSLNGWNNLTPRNVQENASFKMILDLLSPLYVNLNFRQFKERN
jgi:hypothetical protein